jgi:hypothetical protein
MALSTMADYSAWVLFKPPVADLTERQGPNLSEDMRGRSEGIDSIS